jgi:peptide/nickel transport system substrate-binding protein
MWSSSSARRRSLIVAALAALAMALPATAPPAEAATRGGKIIFGRYADSIFLDPVLNDANQDIWILTNLYDTLLNPTVDGQNVEPSLATKWEVKDNNLTVVLTLRQGVKFSDGSDLTAQDIKWSLDRARDPKAGAWNFTLESVDKVEIPDASTVVLKLKHPDPTILPALATFNTAILPQKLFEAMPGATMDDKAKAFAEKPVGTGPFFLDKWQRDVSMVIKRNPHYWKKGEDGKPLPYLDEIEFQTIPDDATRILKLKAGNIDGTELIPYARVAELKAEPSLRMELWPAARLTYLTVNVRPKLKDGTPNPMSDVRVRQALNYALNKDAIIKISTQGIGTPSKSFIPSATVHFYGKEPLFPYNPAKAKALLAEAGFANGFDMTCMQLAGSGDEANNLTAAQQMWAQIGVRMKLEQMDAATRVAKYRADDFQCRAQFWTNDISDPSEETSYVAYFPNVGSLHTGFQDKRIEELFLQSQQEIDFAKRGAQYKEIQEIYNSTGPMLPLYETPYPVAFRKNVKGFIQIPLGMNIFEGTYIEK